MHNNSWSLSASYRAWSNFFLLSALALLFVMPSTQSLWMDESIVALIARRPDFPTFWHLFWHYTQTEVPSAEALKPLYSWSCWIFGRVLGTSEWALRAPNILYMMVGVFCFWRLGRRWRLPYLPLILALFPYVWFYVDEARPYAIQLAAGCGMLYAAVKGLETQGRGQGWLWGMMISSFVMSAASMLGVLTAIPCCLLVLVITWRDSGGLRREWWPVILTGVVIYALLGGYYLLAVYLLHGQEAARIWIPGIANVVFSLYEMTGFSGLGPGRTYLREMAQNANGHWIKNIILQYGWIFSILGLSYLYIGLIALRRRYIQGEYRIIGLCFFVPFAAFALMILVAILTKWPFWGRHMAPAVPFIIVGCVWLIGRHKFLMMVWLGILTFSSLNLRFNPEHGKDDNKMAAKLVHTAIGQGQTVWWVADPYSAVYYQLPVTYDVRKPGVYIGDNPVIPPTLVVLCKPDIFDADGRVRGFLQKYHYQKFGVARSFVFWKLPQEDNL